MIIIARLLRIIINHYTRLPKKTPIFSCEKCDFICSKKTNIIAILLRISINDYTILPKKTPLMNLKHSIVNVVRYIGTIQVSQSISTVAKD